METYYRTNVNYKKSELCLIQENHMIPSSKTKKVWEICEVVLYSTPIWSTSALSRHLSSEISAVRRVLFYFSWLTQMIEIHYITSVAVIQNSWDCSSMHNSRLKFGKWLKDWVRATHTSWVRISCEWNASRCAAGVHSCTDKNWSGRLKHDTNLGRALKCQRPCVNSAFYEYVKGHVQAKTGWYVL